MAIANFKNLKCWEYSEGLYPIWSFSEQYNVLFTSFCQTHGENQVTSLHPDTE